MCSRNCVASRTCAAGHTDTQNTPISNDRCDRALDAVDLSAFQERAAIAEHDGELARHDAEALAAREQGHADANAVYIACVGRWRREIDRLAQLGPATPATAEALKRAQAFIRDSWALQAVRLGWDKLELFGVSVEASSQRLCCMGAAFGGGVQAVTEDAIVHVGGRRFYRATVDREGVIAIWEALSG